MDKAERTAMDERAVEAAAEALRAAGMKREGSSKLTLGTVIAADLARAAIAAYEAAKPAPMSTSGEMVERFDPATTLATQIMALDWKARKDWTVEDQADRHGELQEMIEALFAEQAGELERVKAERDAAVRLARYQLNRGSEDMGVGESDTLRRMVAALPLSGEARALAKDHPAKS